jgi:hypothetical protein
MVLKIFDKIGQDIRDAFGSPLSASPQITNRNGTPISAASPQQRYSTPGRIGTFSGAMNQISQNVNINVNGRNLDLNSPQSIRDAAGSIVASRIGNPAISQITESVINGRFDANNFAIGGKNGGLTITNGELAGVNVGPVGLQFQDGKINAGQFSAGPLSVGFGPDGIAGGFSNGPLSVGFGPNGIAGSFTSGPLNVGFGPGGLSGSFNSGPISASFGPDGFGFNFSSGPLSFSFGTGGFQMNLGLGSSYFEFGGKGPNNEGSGTGADKPYGIDSSNPTQVKNAGYQNVNIAIDTFLKGGGSQSNLGFLVSSMLSPNSNVAGVGALAGSSGDVLGEINPILGNELNRFENKVTQSGEVLAANGAEIGNIPGITPELQAYGAAQGKFGGELGDAILSLPADQKELLIGALQSTLQGNPSNLSSNQVNQLAASLSWDSSPVTDLQTLATAANNLGSKLAENNITNSQVFYEVGQVASSLANIFSANGSVTDGIYQLNIGGFTIPPQDPTSRFNSTSVIYNSNGQQV